MKKLLGSIIAFIALITLTSCAPAQPTTKPAETTANQSSEKLNYDKQDEWEFVSGKMQSPIDIVTADAKASEDFTQIETDYHHELSVVEDNGHAIEAEIEGSAIINGRHFELAQFHVHAKSEHTINGEHADAEIHFVHKAEDGRIAVIAVLIETGAENAAFGQMLSATDTEHGVENFDVQLLFPSNMSYYHYLGSLTTPPLTENVEWYVLKDKITISPEQLKEFNTHYTNNNREVQDLNGRTIISSEQ